MADGQEFGGGTKKLTEGGRVNIELIEHRVNEIANDTKQQGKEINSINIIVTEIKTGMITRKEIFTTGVIIMASLLIAVFAAFVAIFFQKITA